jgi:hypothetical protein
MALETFTDLINAVTKKDPVFTVGTVKAIDEAEMVCTVTPEDGGEDIEDVPLRIMRYADSVGFTTVPVLNTEAIVLWLGPQRPVIFRVHEWDRVIIQNKEGHGIIIKPGSVIIGIEEESEPAVLGDQLAKRITALEGAFNYHTHGGVVAGGGNSGGPSNTVDGEPEVRTWRTRLT